MNARSLRSAVPLLLSLAACAAMRAPSGPPRPSPAWETTAAAEQLRRTGRLGEAEAAFRDALERDPGDLRAHVGLQSIRMERGDDLALRREYRAGPSPFLAGRLEADERRQRTAFRRAPPAEALLGLAGVDERRGILRRAMRLYAALLASDPGHLWGRIGMGRTLLHARRDGLAAALLEDADWIDPAHPSPASGRSLLADRRGDREEALRFALEAYRRVPADAGAARRAYDLAWRGRSDEERERTADVLLAGEGSQGVAPLLAGRLLRRAGRADRAAEAFARARAEGATEAEVRASQPSTAPSPGFARFADSLRRGVEARYRHYAATGQAESFEEFRAWACRLFERDTGTRLGAPPPPVRFAFVGTLVDPTASSTDPLVRACAAEGFLLAMGQRRGGPPEAMLAPIVEREPMAAARVRGLEVVREVVRIAEPELTGYQEWAGAGDLAGLALDRIVLLDTEGIARWDGDVRRRIARIGDGRERILAEAALDDAPVDSLDDPAGEYERLLLVAPMDLEREVRVHEDAHLVDAALHLPVGAHPFRNLALALGRGFDAQRIQAYLERNAQLAAIAEGPNPHAALAPCVGGLGGGGPHAAGYAEIVEALVREIRRDPARYPEVDPRRVLLQQLHRVPADSLRAAARAVAREWGIAFLR